MMPKIKGVLIDFVGTLVSFKPDPEAALREMHDALRKMGIDIEMKQLSESYQAAHLKYREIRHEQLVEVSNEIWIRDALEQLGLDSVVGGTLRVLADAYFRSFVKGAMVFPGVRETLDYLRQKNYKLALVSNFSYARVPEGLLKVFELDRYFDVLAISEKVGYRKPHPAMFQHAVRELGVRVEEAVMVGDTQTEDVYGAKKVGMAAFQIREEAAGYYTPYKVKKAGEDRFLRPDAVIENLSELMRLL